MPNVTIGRTRHDSNYPPQHFVSPLSFFSLTTFIAQKAEANYNGEKIKVRDKKVYYCLNKVIVA
jgi:hypothetical protein